MTHHNPEMIADLIRQNDEMRSELRRFCLAVADLVRHVHSAGDVEAFRPELTRVEAALGLAQALLEKP